MLEKGWISLFKGEDPQVRSPGRVVGTEINLKRIGFLIVSSFGPLAACAMFNGAQTDKLHSDESFPHCLRLNDAYGPRQSISCERIDVYDFLIAGQRWTFEKRSYQERLRVRIGNWLLRQGIPLEQISSGKIEVWVGTHVFAPDLPLMRVQVVAAGGNVLIEMPFDPAAWNETISSVYILGNGFYPEHAGIKAGKLLVELKPGIKAREFRGTLEKVRGLALTDGSDDFSSFYVTTPFLREAKSRHSLIRAAQVDSGLQQISFVPAGEVAGQFVKAFEFTLIPPK
jgi:hypothetical protein